MRKTDLDKLIILLIKLSLLHSCIGVRYFYKPNETKEPFNEPQAIPPKHTQNFKSRLPTCGKRKVYHSPRPSFSDQPLLKIVGGKPVPYGAYPWMVHIESLSFDGFDHACGGTLISNSFVITAAHCVYGLDTREIRLKVGDFDSEVVDFSERIYAVEDWRVHPKFRNGGIYNNDIAVLKVKGSRTKGVKLGPYVAPACLPSKGTTLSPGTLCYVTGWGLTDSAQYIHSTLLRAASVPLIPNEICGKEEVIGSKRFHPGMMCAGYLSGNVDACNGDSGGPLVCEIEGLHTVVGVVSWGIDCGRENKPGVYADVQFYLDFIKSAMKELSTIQKP